MMSAANKPVIVAIDGPAASGKGTLARRLATHLELPYLDTGSLYRAVAWRVLEDGNSPDDESVSMRAANVLKPSDLEQPGLRTLEVGQAASVVAAQKSVRQALIDFQRRFGERTGAVLDGRDVGTVIFPDATIKLFVTADLDVRAERRWRELQTRGQDSQLETVKFELYARDARDMERQEAPLRMADDAFLLNTSALDANQAFASALEEVLRHLRDR